MSASYILHCIHVLPCAIIHQLLPSLWAVRAGPHYPQRLLLIADWGLSYNSSSTLDHALASAKNASGPAIVLFVGDYSYAGVQRSLASKQGSRVAIGR